MLTVAPLRQRELAAVTELFNRAMATLPYHRPLTSEQFRRWVLLNDGAPDADLSVDPAGWLVANEGDRTVGFAHCAVGRLADQPRETRWGFLRLLLLLSPQDPQAAAALLAAADAYFAAQGVGHIAAFHIRTGYPCHLAGRGVLAGHAFETMEALGRAGYRMGQRWLLYERLFGGHLPERLPQRPHLTLRFDEAGPQGFALSVFSGYDPVADLTCTLLPELSEHTGMATASLRRLYVHEAYRRQGVGRWLLLRCLNELATRQVQRLVADISHADAAAQALLLHLGFIELPLSGYSFAKTVVAPATGVRQP
ncbi:MAG: GNAT family N-acetyltransferase [Caldilineales bacterium]|nr:GNAT family N-acetyltransferase [Caldilineales bacterium]